MSEKGLIREANSPDSDKESVVKWLREIDQEIRRKEVYLQSFGNISGGIPDKEKYEKELAGLRETREKYKKLLEEAEEKQ